MSIRLVPAGVVLAVVCHPLFADVAPTRSYTLIQPDGFTFEARAFGDERRSRVETMEGRVLVDVLDEQGAIRWYYAVPGPDGTYVASATAVGPDTVTHPFDRARFEAEHHKRAVAGQVQAFSEPPGRRITAPAEPQRVFRPLVFLVDFPGSLPQQSPRVRYTKDHFVKLVFAEGLDPSSTTPHLPATYTRSVRDYYAEVSSDRFLVEGSADSVVDWTTTRNSYSYYVDGCQGKGIGTHGKARSAAAVCVELAQAMDGAVNYADFDGDADGVVDAVILIMEGWADTGAQNQFASFKDTLFSVGNIDAGAPRDSRGFLQLDGVIFKGIVVTTEQAYEDGYQDFDRGDVHPIGTLCHELGHVIGLPDLYDLTSVYKPDDPDSQVVTSAGIGRWGLMSYGVWTRQTSPSYPCAWCRSRMGWVTPALGTTGPQPTTLSLPPCEVNDVVYKIPLRPDDTTEYFLLENRRRIGSDQHLKGEGLLIWHVDENFTDLFPGSNTINNIEATPGVNLMQADGLGDLYRDVNGSNANYGDAGDPFPGLTGKTQFTDQTIPNSRPYQYDRNADGMVDVAGNSGVSVSSIAVGPEGVISCVVAGPAGTAFELGYDAGHFENVHNKWGENRAGIMLVPATSCYLRNVRTVFRNSSPEQHLEGYTIRVWRGFDERRRRPTSLIHSQSGTVDWTASDPEREGGWVTLPIQGDVLCEAGVGHYLEVEYTGFGYVMPYDGDWYTGRLPSGRSYWRLSGTDACTPFAYGDWNLHAILQEAAQATVTP